MEDLNGGVCLIPSFAIVTVLVAEADDTDGAENAYNSSNNGENEISVGVIHQAIKFGDLILWNLLVRTDTHSVVRPIDQRAVLVVILAHSNRSEDENRDSCKQLDNRVDEFQRLEAVTRAAAVLAARLLAIAGIKDDLED